MIKIPTLFILGAGFSKEVGMPLGWELKNNLANFLRKAIGDSPGALLQNLFWKIGEEESRASCKAIIKALPGALSIDTLVEQWADDETIRRWAKIAIVAAILRAEAGSALTIPREQLPETGMVRRVGGEPRRRRPNLNQAAETAFLTLYQLLAPGLPRDEIERGLKNVAFINFNYDRCLEHYLYEALRDYAGFPSARAAELVQSIPIWHPYGSVGKLPWMNRAEGESSVNFGDALEETDILRISEGINTFSEEMQERAELDDMRQRITDSKRILFLGLSYNEQNMSMLRPPHGAAGVRFYGTLYKPPPKDPGGLAIPSLQDFADIDSSVFESAIKQWRYPVEQNFKRDHIYHEINGGFDVLTCRQLLSKWENRLRSEAP